MTEHKIHLQKLYEEFIVFSRERKETAINDLKTFSISTAPKSINTMKFLYII